MMTGWSGKIRSLGGGFTLYELVIVTAIISAAVSVCLPYATRSRVAEEVRQEASNIRETLIYGLRLAEGSGKNVRVVFDFKGGRYCLQVEDEGDRFEVSERFPRGWRNLSDGIKFVESGGMEVDGEFRFVEFSRDVEWPRGEVSVVSSEVSVDIIVEGRDVRIEEIGI